jgi:hypothetical protein
VQPWSSEHVNEPIHLAADLTDDERRAEYQRRDWL